MLDKKVVELLQTQINKELYSAYLYMEIANYYIDADLDGFGNWYTIQAQEERDHALLFLRYLQSNGIKPVLASVDAPEGDFNSHLDPLLKGAEHERYVTSLIHDIYDAAYTVKDFRTMQFLDWFVKEQLEEEENADKLVNKYKLFGDDPKSLYLLDQELSARVYSAPSLTI